MPKPVDYATGLESGRIRKRKEEIRRYKREYNRECHNIYNDIVENHKDKLNEELKRLGIYNDLTKAC